MSARYREECEQAVRKEAHGGHTGEGACLLSAHVVTASERGIVVLLITLRLLITIYDSLYIAMLNHSLKSPPVQTRSD